MKTKFTLLSTLILCSMLAGGCGYSTTSRTAKDIKSIYVPFFTNETTEPNLDITVTESLINNLISDNTLKVVDEVDADAILDGKIVGFSNRPYSFDLDLNAQEYKVIIRVQASLYKRRSNEVIWNNRTIVGESTYFIEPVEGENDFETALNQSIETITERILNLTVQDW